MKLYEKFEKQAKKAFTAEEAEKVGEQLGITWDDYDVIQFRRGMDVELEHGTVNPDTDVTGDDPLLVGKIALAHLNELPDYYDRLDKMEVEGKKALKKKDTPEGKEVEEQEFATYDDLKEMGKENLADEFMEGVKSALKMGENLNKVGEKEWKEGEDYVHIDIQPYVIDGVKHYRARITGEEDFNFETKPGETLDQFRGRIMYTLDKGIVTHFLKDWVVGSKKEGGMPASELALYCLNNWDDDNIATFMGLLEEGIVEDISEQDVNDLSAWKVGGKTITPVKPDPYQNENGLFNYKWEIKSGKIKGMKHTPRDYFLPGNAHLISSWETRGGRYYYDLYEVKDGYMYTTPGGFGSLGNISKEEGIAEVEDRIKAAKEIDGITYRRVL